MQNREEERPSVLEVELFQHPFVTVTSNKPVPEETTAEVTVQVKIEIEESEIALQLPASKQTSSDISIVSSEENKLICLLESVNEKLKYVSAAETNTDTPVEQTVTVEANSVVTEKSKEKLSDPSKENPEKLQNESFLLGEHVETKESKAQNAVLKEDIALQKERKDTDVVVTETNVDPKKDNDFANEGQLCQFNTETVTMIEQLAQEEELFLKAVSLCHTVQINNDQADGICDNPWHTDSIASQLEYYASSPDEKALVEAACRIGVVFTGTDGESMEIKSVGRPERKPLISPQAECFALPPLPTQFPAPELGGASLLHPKARYKLLHVLEFDPCRRRMSVIVESPSGDKLLFTKGAESAVLPYSTRGEIEKTRVHVDEFALKGLRTLCVAYRKFMPEEYEEVDRRLYEAKTALQQREERLAEAFNFIERDLDLLGATGVEDKLQDKVQETIEALRLAGIKVWVLTGDKHETAVSVSLSCGHFHRTMNILELVQHKSDSTCAEQLRQLARRIKDDHVIQHGLVVDGTSLSLALRQHEKLFMEVCRNCSAVLCCRMAPLQKAKVVRLIKTTPEKPITLAIGDGANDVSMIQEAHVGIGIMGKEGRQAVRNSDYAIARFKFLSKLLFAHGHLYYIRIATLVQYFFYKTLYDSVYLTLYNICFTSLPVLMYSLFEQHVHPHVLQSKPALYR
ncbi:UNVERIFIED_CONTAM: putative phospholipid-transporting ATPase IF, partial [Gekko kuhli]